MKKVINISEKAFRSERELSIMKGERPPYLRPKGNRK